MKILPLYGLGRDFCILCYLHPLSFDALYPAFASTLVLASPDDVYLSWNTEY